MHNLQHGRTLGTCTASPIANQTLYHRPMTAIFSFGTTIVLTSYQVTVVTCSVSIINKQNSIENVTVKKQNWTIWISQKETEAVAIRR